MIPKFASRSPVEHKIKRTNDGGSIRIACSCGVAFNTDNGVWADRWQHTHLLGQTARKRNRKHEAETP